MDQITLTLGRVASGSKSQVRNGSEADGPLRVESGYCARSPKSCGGFDVRLLCAVVPLMLSACDRDVHKPILDKDPFYSERITIPADGAKGILSRSAVFASRHKMTLDESTYDVPREYYYVFLRNERINIVAADVIEGKKTYLTAYSWRAPTEVDVRLLYDYRCHAFRQCEPPPHAAVP